VGPTARLIQGEFVVVFRGVHEQSQPHLAHVVAAGATSGRLPGPVQGRQEDAHEQGDHCNHYKQLDQSECRVAGRAMRYGHWSPPRPRPGISILPHIDTDSHL